MTIEPEFHPMIIGKKGETVRNLRNKYGVQVNLPRRGEGNNENIVTVVGYQQKAELARDEIQEMVDKLVSIFIKTYFLYIDVLYTNYIFYYFIIFRKMFTKKKFILTVEFIQG